MINLDMIGRPEGRLLVGGLDSAPDLEPDLRAALETVPLTIRTFRDGANMGSSDDASFVTRRVPSIVFFSGFHSDYHRPSDDWNTIDAEGGAAVARLALALAERYSNRAERIAFTGAPRDTGHEGTPNPSSTGGYGPYFGSVPDLAGEGKGVRFLEIRADSPAASAGLRAGDVLVRFGDKPVAHLYDFTYALRNHQPGDKVSVAVVRDGKEVTATVELGTRP
jgi:membrane-associated protease RseP (regulator of RpoE activity)